MQTAVISFFIKSFYINRLIMLSEAPFSELDLSLTNGKDSSKITINNLKTIEFHGVKRFCFLALMIYSDY